MADVTLSDRCRDFYDDMADVGISYPRDFRAQMLEHPAAEVGAAAALAR